MKKVYSFVAIALLTTGAIFAQGFNGKIKYSFKAEGEGMEQAAAFMPNSMVMTYLKQNMILEFEGGMMTMMMGKMLFNGKKGKGYMIKDSEETIYIMDSPKEEEEKEGHEPVVENTGETTNIAGYECAKYAITTETPMGEQISYAWVTDKIQPTKPKKGGNLNMGGIAAISAQGLPGMPLKVEMQAGAISIILEAMEVDSRTPDKKLFKLPKGYDKEDFNPNMFGGGGMGF